MQGLVQHSGQRWTYREDIIQVDLWHCTPDDIKHITADLQSTFCLSASVRFRGALDSSHTAEDVFHIA